MMSAMGAARWLAKGRLGGKALADFGLVRIGQLLKVFDRADIVEVHPGRREFLLVEGGVRLEIGHLRAQPFFLDTAHLIERQALDLVPEPVVPLGERVLSPKAHSELHVFLPWLTPRQ